jgi:hypothetical protein
MLSIHKCHNFVIACIAGAVLTAGTSDQLVATTQRILYDFSCKPRYAVLMERISMDLNGTFIKHELFETYVAAYDPAASRVLNTFCPLRDRD